MRINSKRNFYLVSVCEMFFFKFDGLTKFAYEIMSVAYVFDLTEFVTQLLPEI